MVQVGAGKINRRPCTEAETFRNWSITTQNFENISILLQEGAGGDTYKVAVNATDVGNATPDYLHAKIDQANVPDATKCAVRSVTVGDLTELLYWSAEDISGYGDTGFRVMSLSGGELIWSEIATDIDDKTVKVTASDSVSSFLHDAFHLNATYVGGADLLIATETVGSGGTDQKERPFVDVSIVSGWHASAFRVLGISSNVSQYFTAAELGTVIYASGPTLIGIYFDGTSLRAGYHLIRGLAKGAVTADDTTFKIDNIKTLASGLDPRTDTNDAAEELTVHNIQKERFADNQPLTAIYDLVEARWEVLLVERYRALRGIWHSGTSTLQVKNIVPLDSGLDPRVDTTDADETVDVLNLPGDTYSAGEYVYADYNVNGGDGTPRWEARPKAGSGGSGPIECKVTSSEITASGVTAGVYTPGTGTVIDVDSSAQEIGESFEVTNRDAWSYPQNARVWRFGTRIDHGNCFPDTWPTPV